MGKHGTNYDDMHAPSAEEAMTPTEPVAEAGKRETMTSGVNGAATTGDQKIPLLPCPFCGESARIRKLIDDPSTYRAECTGEHCFSPFTDTCSSNEDAAFQWNDRPDTTAPELLFALRCLVGPQEGDEHETAVPNDSPVKIECQLGDLRRAWVAIANATGDARGSPVVTDQRAPRVMVLRAQPPQPTGDVGLTKSERFTVENCRHAMAHDQIAFDLVPIIDRLNSRLAAQEQEFDKRESEFNELYGVVASQRAEFKAKYENGKFRTEKAEARVAELEKALTDIVAAFVNPHDGGEFEVGEVPVLDAARAALSPTEPAGRGG